MDLNMCPWQGDLNDPTIKKINFIKGSDVPHLDRLLQCFSRTSSTSSSLHSNLNFEVTVSDETKIDYFIEFEKLLEEESREKQRLSGDHKLTIKGFPTHLSLSLTRSPRSSRYQTMF